MSLEKARSVFDWFFGKEKGNQLILLLIGIIGVLGYFSYQNLQEAKLELAELKGTVVSLGKEVASLKEENYRLKYNSILLLDADKMNPNPEWIVSSEDSKVMWVNSAYEKKHLIPRGYTAVDLIGTDGSSIFGVEVVNSFKANNKMVKDYGRAKTFNNELNKTLKYPISKGGVVYAIKGTEWLEHN